MVVFDGTEHIGELPGVPAKIDRFRVAGAAAAAMALLHPLLNELVSLLFLIKIPNLDVLFFDDGRAAATVDFDPLEIAWECRGGGFDLAQGAAGKSQRRQGS